MTRRWLLLFCNIVVMFQVSSSPATALGSELIVNGSFEEPVAGAGRWEIFGSIPGWNSSGPGIEIQNNAYGAPFDALQLVELDTTGSSNIFQDVPTVAGDLYRLQFAYSPRPGVFDNSIAVYWNASLVDTLDSSGLENSDTRWSVSTYDLVGSAGSTRLEFVDVGVSDGLGGYLDRVSVASVPEPSSLALFGAGLVALSARNRHKRTLKRRGGSGY